MTAALAIIAALGWSAAITLRAALSVTRLRVKKLREQLSRQQYDLDFSAEKLAEFIDRMNKAEDETMHLQGKLRAYETRAASQRSKMVN